MGVPFKDLVHSEEISIKDLAGKKIAVDAHNTLYQFVSTIRQYDGSPLADSKGRITSHLSGLFYRTTKIMSDGVKPCFVFDGKPPVFKNNTVSTRRNAREKAREEYEQALKVEDYETARSKSMQMARLTPEMIEESKKLLKFIGVPVIQAPCEGEAQASHMCRNGDVFACVSQDYDSLLFKSPVLVRNLNITGKRKIPYRNAYVNISPEMIVLKKELERLGLSQEQLIMLAILVGTDYNPKGIFGIGPKTAYKRVKELKTFNKIFAGIEWSFDVSPKEIFDLFMNHPVTDDYSLKWEEPDDKALIKLLCSEHEFGEDRVVNALKRVRDFNKSKSQTGL
ncbi:flap endonuclease-1, partial [archaeon CG_4_10_14_0_2_um_filter_Archaea_38_6]